MAEEKNYLYRGLNTHKYVESQGALIPKENHPFKKLPKWDIAQWGASWNESSENAVVEHQHKQLGLPTSGLSTTPHFERAKFYALGGGKYKSGFVQVLDREKVDILGVTEYIVWQIVSHPSVPADDEVILVASDFGEISQNIVVEIIPVS